MHTNLESAQRDIVADLKRQLEGLDQELIKASSHVDACQRTLALHGRTEKNLQILFQRAEDYSEGLREALEKEDAEGGNIDALQVALREAEEEKQLNEGSFKDSEAAMADKTRTLIQVRRELAQHESGLKTLNTNLEVAESEKKLVQSKRRTLHDDKNAAVALINDDKEARANTVQKREQVQERVTEYNEKASMVSSRVPVGEGETPRSLEAKLERLGRDINRYNAQYVASLDFISLLTGVDWEPPGTKLLLRQREQRQSIHEPSYESKMNYLSHG